MKIIHNDSVLSILIVALAVYRLALMLSSDTGPYAMFSKLRSWLKKEAKDSPALRKSKLQEGVSCIRCSSVWLSAPLGVYMFTFKSIPEWMVLSTDCLIVIMALSAASILIHRAFKP